nr:MAG TPA: hypothetical protein [Caudoviricetes sp.]
MYNLHKKVHVDMYSIPVLLFYMSTCILRPSKGQRHRAATAPAGGRKRGTYGTL